MLTPQHESADSDWQVEVFFDGKCPLCRREVNLLRYWDRHGRIRATDIAEKDFSPQSYGKSMDELMAEIHGRLPDGQWIVGVEVFRRLYAAVGLAPFVWISRLPIASHLLEFAYRLFARNRLRLTGRCTTEACRIR